MRDHNLYLDDIYAAIVKVEHYTVGLTFAQFRKNDLIIDGVVRNLEIIGEAAKKTPAVLKNRNLEIEWKKIAGLRDILAHEYFNVDLEVLWDIIKNKLPVLKCQVDSIRK